MNESNNKNDSVIKKIIAFYRKLPPAIKANILTNLGIGFGAIISVFVSILIFLIPLIAVSELAKGVGDFFDSKDFFLFSNSDSKLLDIEEAYYKKLNSVKDDYLNKDKGKVEIDISLIHATLFYDNILPNYVENTAFGTDDESDIRDAIDFHKKAKSHIKELAKAMIVNEGQTSARIDTTREGKYYQYLKNKNLWGYSFIELYYPDEFIGLSSEEKDKRVIEIIEGIFDFYSLVKKEKENGKMNYFGPSGANYQSSGGVNYRTCEDISYEYVKELVVSREEFIEKTKVYAEEGNISKATQKKLFMDANYMGLVYDLGVEYNINPEIVTSIILKENSVSGEYNYYGIAHTNEKSSGKGFENDEEALRELYAKYIKKGNIKDVFSMFNTNRYSFIGYPYKDKKVWINPGNWGSGGCIYLDYIKDYLSDDRYQYLKNQVCVSSKSCPGDDCEEITDEDQFAYSAWMTKSKMNYYRRKIFGEYENRCNFSSQLVNYKNPTVFIYNSHYYEKYLDGKTVVDGANSFANELRIQGINTIVDSSSNSSASKAYSSSREVLKKMKEKYPTLSYFIDFHRDSGATSSTEFATISFVVGKGVGDDLYQKNKTFATKLKDDLILRNKPGLARSSLIEKSTEQGNGIYNQDIANEFDDKNINIILAEFGTENDPFSKVENSIKEFADVYANYIKSNSLLRVEDYPENAVLLFPNIIEWKQGDPIWKDIKINGIENKTVGNVGCYITAIANGIINNVTDSSQYDSSVLSMADFNPGTFTEVLNKNNAFSGANFTRVSATQAVIPKFSLDAQEKVYVSDTQYMEFIKKYCDNKHFFVAKTTGPFKAYNGKESHSNNTHFIYVTGYFYDESNVLWFTINNSSGDKINSIKASDVDRIDCFRFSD